MYVNVTNTTLTCNKLQTTIIPLHHIPHQPKHIEVEVESSKEAGAEEANKNIVKDSQFETNRLNHSIILYLLTMKMN